jgi:hypothetical protein
MNIRVLSVVAIGIWMSSCGSKSLQDVNVSELETACDCAEAMVIGMTEEKELKEAKEDSEVVEKWESKMKEISMHCRGTKKFDMEEIRECEVMQKAKEKLSK